MVVILLIIIACCLLFGKEATKNGISNIFTAFFVLLIIAGIVGSCGS